MVNDNRSAGAPFKLGTVHPSICQKAAVSLDGRQPGHYTGFGVTSGLPVTRPEPEGQHWTHSLKLTLVLIWRQWVDAAATDNAIISAIQFEEGDRISSSYL
jgi:hypothetical protein